MLKEPDLIVDRSEVRLVKATILIATGELSSILA
jgi:hypothetical protein